MRNINEISFEEFAETMTAIDAIATQGRSLFIKMLLRICQECRLADEMFFFIEDMPSEELGKLPEFVEHHKVILAMWLLLNDCKRSNTTIH